MRAFALFLLCALSLVSPASAQRGDPWSWFDARVAQQTPEAMGLVHFRAALEANVPSDFLHSDLVSRDVLLAVITRGAANLDLQGLLALKTAVEQLGPNASAGARMRVVLGRLGPGYVKLGQFLANRPDILSPEDRAEIAALSTHAEPMDSAIVEARFHDELQALANRTLREHGDHHATTSFDARQLVRTFHREPLGTGSMGQAHRVELVNGEQLVFKMLKPGVRDAILRDFAGILEVATAAGHSAFHDLIAAIRDQSLREADLRNEGAAFRDARNELRHFGVNVPQVIDGMVGEDHLLMELAPGNHDSNQLGGIARTEMAHRVFRTALYLVLFADRFHGDPHRGNVLYGQARGLPMISRELSMIDWGLTGTLTFREKVALVELVGGIVSRSQPVVVHALRSVAPELTQEQTEAVRRGLNAEGSALHRAQDVLLNLQGAGFRVPASYLQASKALLLAEGVARELDPDFSPVPAIAAMVPMATARAVLRLNPFSRSEASPLLRESIMRGRGAQLQALNLRSHRTSRVERVRSVAMRSVGRLPGASVLRIPAGHRR